MFAYIVPAVSNPTLIPSNVVFISKQCDFGLLISSMFLNLIFWNICNAVITLI